MESVWRPDKMHYLFLWASLSSRNFTSLNNEEPFPSEVEEEPLLRENQESVIELKTGTKLPYEQCKRCSGHFFLCIWIGFTKIGSMPWLYKTGRKILLLVGQPEGINLKEDSKCKKSWHSQTPEESDFVVPYFTTRNTNKNSSVVHLLPIVELVSKSKAFVHLKALILTHDEIMHCVFKKFLKENSMYLCYSCDNPQTSVVWWIRENWSLAKVRAHWHFRTLSSMGLESSRLTLMWTLQLPINKLLFNKSWFIWLTQSHFAAFKSCATVWIPFPP